MKTCVFSVALAILVVTSAFASPASKGSNKTEPDKNCVSKDLSECSCEMTDGSGIVDLTSIGYTNNEPRFKDYKAPDGAMYSYNPCHGFTVGNCTDSAVCMTQGTSTMTIGQAEPVGFQYDKDLKTVEVAYHSKQKKVTAAVVTLICDQHACEPVFDPSGGDEWGVYLFKMTSVCACPGMCTSSGASSCKLSEPSKIGTVICLGILAIVSSYLLCGIMFKWLRHKGPNVIQCKDIIPHYELWSSLPGLIKDGVFFTFGCCLPGVHTYQPAPTVHSQIQTYPTDGRFD